MTHRESGPGRRFTWNVGEESSRNPLVCTLRRRAAVLQRDGIGRNRCNPVRDVQRVLLFHGEHTWESPIAGVRLRYGWNGGLPVEEVRLHRSRYPPDLQSRRADKLAEEFAGSSSAAHARPLACETSPIQGVRELPLNAVGELREKVAADHVSPRYARIRDNAGNDSGVGERASRNNS